MDLLISEDLRHPAIDRLAEKFSVARDGSLWRDPARLKSEVAGARGLLVRNQTRVTAEIIEATSRLVVIGRVGVGLDNIDLPAATRRGVRVVAPLEANAVSVAELAIGLLLALARKIPAADRATRAGGWDRVGATGVELAGKTLGLCGFGRIGRLVAVRARAFGLRVLAYDPFLRPGDAALAATQADYCGSLDELLAATDFVSLHLPLTPETRHLFNAPRFAAMRPGSYFINTSRGGVMDETALIAALQSGPLAGAAVDVREVEPPGAVGVLESLPNVILLPHVGAFTREAQDRTFEAVVGDVERLLTGQPARYAVNPISG